MVLKDGFYHPSLYWPKAIKKSLPCGIQNTYITDHAIKRMNDRGISLNGNIDFKDWKVVEAEVRSGKVHSIRIKTKKPDHNQRFLVIAVLIEHKGLRIISLWYKDSQEMDMLNPSYVRG